jgi:hypothetical protein
VVLFRLARRPSPVARRPPSAARRPSPVARRPSPVARRPSPVARSLPPAARRPSHVARVRRPSPVAAHPSLPRAPPHGAKKQKQILKIAHLFCRWKVPWPSQTYYKDMCICIYIYIYRYRYIYIDIYIYIYRLKPKAQAHDAVPRSSSPRTSPCREPLCLQPSRKIRYFGHSEHPVSAIPTCTKIVHCALHRRVSSLYSRTHTHIEVLKIDNILVGLPTPCSCAPSTYTLIHDAVLIGT